jgi:hypothetical protein
MLSYEMYKILPPTMRLQLKKLLHASGHSASMVDRLKAKRDALGKRRLDRAFDHMVSTIARTECAFGRYSRGLDFGSGYVLTDAVSLWLLGAQQVVALDLNAIAKRNALELAISSTSLNAVARIAGRLPQPSQGIAVERARQLFSGRAIDDIPITYAAPVDILAAHNLGRFDRIWSSSVLEHVPPSLLPRMMSKLHELLAPGGSGCHFIDLRDHLDFNQPFRFRTNPDGYVAERDADARGNGLNVAEWHALLAPIGAGFELEPLGSSKRLARADVANDAEYYEFALLIQRS